MEVTFHHDLSGQGSGDRRTLTGGDQGNREQDRREFAAEQRLQEMVRVLDLTDRKHAVSKKGRSGQYQDGGIYKEGEIQGDDGVDKIEPDRASNSGVAAVDPPGLDQ